MDLLPDCRQQRQTVRVNRGMLGTWLPVFCANCGTDGGLVPEENMTFCYYLCNQCAETYGQVANTYMMPDEVFFQRVAEEQLARYGRYLAVAEWACLEASHPLMQLLREQPKGG